MAVLAHGHSVTRRLELERRAFLDLLRMANTLSEPKEIAQQLVVLAQHLSGCEAVAVRLKVGPGFPYAANLGLPERFVAMEDDLCLRDDGGHLLRDEQRQPLLACLCGGVLSGQIDRQEPSFTDRGSFVTASTTQLLAAHAGSECLGRTRNRCQAAGYETVGLFPIRRDGVTYGLIQCNDRRPRRLSAETIDLLENLAASAAHLLQLTMA
ncbi:MAG: GAF domain-containing protein [Holophagaceae bacterium]|uniref:GAF domain-containing protein n=1 Tax=Candidatus Geothrix skivensis TaxID=2954439 RepID=A0A9D7SK27_9BACT|nr:GAF domain-containing protein [Candidatus Geothrix skivensis]